jgi:DNA invertase Pin-like site-specific DNA recombinase
VSTAEQADSGSGLAAQDTAIEAACSRRNLELVETFTDVASGVKADRPGLTEALGHVGPGGAGVLVVAKQDRITRSLFQLSDLLDQAERGGWALVIADTDLDTRTTNGKLVAGVMGSIAEWERSRIAERTREGLAEKRQAGVRLGRPRTIGADVRARVVELRAEGLSWAAIAAALDVEGWQTTKAGRWHPTQVRRLWLAEA